MSTPQKKRKARTTLIIFFGILIGPFFYASYLFNNAARHNIGSTNYGALFTPVLSLTTLPVAQNDPKSMLESKWGFVFVTLADECDGQCEKALYHMRQIHKALHKNQSRVKRIAWLGPRTNREQFMQLVNESYHGMQVFDVDSDINQISHYDNFAQGMLLLDPHGNVVLEYQPDADPKKTMKDIKRLLSVSQIG